MYLKNIFSEKSRQSEEILIRSEISSSLKGLEIAINKISPKVFKEYTEKLKAMNANKNNGIQPEMTIHLKEFPFTEDINKCLKDLTSSKTELYELTHSDGNQTTTLKDYLSDWIREDVFRLWPNEWMRIDTLLHKVKIFSKQKTPKKRVSESSKKAQQSADNVRQIVSTSQGLTPVSVTTITHSERTTNSEGSAGSVWFKAGTSNSDEPAAKRAKVVQCSETDGEKNYKSEGQSDIEQEISEAFSGDFETSFNHSPNESKEKTKKSSPNEKSRYNLRSKTDKSLINTPMPVIEDELHKEILGISIITRNKLTRFNAVRRGLGLALLLRKQYKNLKTPLEDPFCIS